MRRGVIPAMPCRRCEVHCWKGVWPWSDPTSKQWLQFWRLYKHCLLGRVGDRNPTLLTAVKGIPRRRLLSPSLIFFFWIFFEYFFLIIFFDYFFWLFFFWVFFIAYWVREVLSIRICLTATWNSWSDKDCRYTHVACGCCLRVFSVWRACLDMRPCKSHTSSDTLLPTENTRRRQVFSRTPPLIVDVGIAHTYSPVPALNRFSFFF
jgi:hypothetical protein